MNVITPLKTPWMLSTTVRELTLLEEGEDLKVTFLGFFGNFVSEEEKRYQDIQVTFSGVNEYRYFPDCSESDTKRLEGFNWEKVPEYRDEEGSLASHRKIFDSIWIETSICPDSSVYEIRESSWVAESSSCKPLKHYLILGGDYNLEVLAESCNADL